METASYNFNVMMLIITFLQFLISLGVMVAYCFEIKRAMDAGELITEDDVWLMNVTVYWVLLCYILWRAYAF